MFGVFTVVCVEHSKGSAQVLSVKNFNPPSSCQCASAGERATSVSPSTPPLHQAQSPLTTGEAAAAAHSGTANCHAARRLSGPRHPSSCQAGGTTACSPCATGCIPPPVPSQSTLSRVCCRCRQQPAAVAHSTATTSSSTARLLARPAAAPPRTLLAATAAGGAAAAGAGKFATSSCSRRACWQLQWRHRHCRDPASTILVLPGRPDAAPAAASSAAAAQLLLLLAGWGRCRHPRRRRARARAGAAAAAAERSAPGGRRGCCCRSTCSCSCCRCRRRCCCRCCHRVRLG